MNQLDKTRADLTRLAELSDKTDQAERRILEAATSRLDAVNKQIDELRSDAFLDADVGERYQGLIVERGKLNLVIAQARQHLS